MTAPTDDQRREEIDGEEERSWMPSPPAAAVAILAMLGFGVLLGSATSQIAQSAGVRSILLEVAPSAKKQPVATESAAEPVAETAAPAPVPVEPAPLPPPVAAAPEPAPEEAASPTLPPEIPETETLPPVKHVFLIVLGENGFEDSFGAASPAPYLAKTLPEKGELLSNYYAVAPSDLANQIALLSGQGPTPETATDCPTYSDLLPGTLSAAGQVEGSGCVYPAETPTLPGQLVEKKLTWRAYVEDIGNGAASGQPATCRRPALGTADGSQAPLPGDAYVTWRNPFVYFHSLADGPECATADVGLDRLPFDLKTAAKTPSLSYIVPNACHDGGELPCAEGQPSGPLAAEEFLQRVVPAIEASPAYKEGGLIAITSALAPQSGSKVDSSSCCIAPKYPNLPPVEAPEEATGPVKPSGGGGRVGLLLLSPFVAAGSVNESGYYNHYSLLRSIEELFELEPIGYASEIALAPFDSSVYNAEATPEATLPKAPRKGANSPLLRTVLGALGRGLEQQRQLPRLRQ